jgi:hypothetical protein
MYELPPEQLQLRAKRYCAAAIHTYFANVCDERPHNMACHSSVVRESKFFHVATSQTGAEDSRSSTELSHLPKRRVLRGNGTVRDTSSVGRPQRGPHPSDAGRSPFSNLSLTTVRNGTYLKIKLATLG